MKNLIAAFIVAIFSAIAVQAQDAPASAAVISFEKETHDYGTIKQGADGDYEFKFTNTGKEPLIITDAKGSCGCTVPTWPKDPIKPGETRSIKVSYDTKRVGAFTKTVTITSNANEPNKMLTIKGNVEASETSQEQTTPVKKIEMGATPVESAPLKTR